MVTKTSGFLLCFLFASATRPTRVYFNLLGAIARGAGGGESLMRENFRRGRG